MELQHGEGCGDDNEADSKAESVCVGVEKLLQLSEQPAHNSAEGQGCDYLNKGIYENGYNVHNTAGKGAGYAEGNGENDKTDGIVQRNYGEQQAGEGAFCLILTDNHEGGCGSGSGGDGAQRNGLSGGELVGHHLVYDEQRNVDQDGGCQSLQNTDDGRLLAGVLQIGKAEFIADRECDEAEGNLADKGQGGYICTGVEAEALNSKSTETEGTDDNTGHKICGDVGKLEGLEYAGHHKTGEDCYSYRKQSMHNEYLQI